MDTYVINGVCRCCASQGSSKDIDTSYTWMGGEEIYSKMLRDCFDIALSRSVSGHDGGICELCVTQLRNAYNFKKQVVSTEEMLKKRLNSDQFKPSLVKVELEVHPERISDSDNDMGDHMDQDSGDDHSTKEFLVPIKSEVQEAPEVKPKRRATKAGTSAAKKPKLEAETSKSKLRLRSKSNIDVVIKKERTDDESEEENLSLSLLEDRNIKKKAPEQKPKRGVEVAKLRDNIQIILACSNATPIKNKDHFGYSCNFCKDKFKEAAGLKVHTLDVHKKEFSTFYTFRALQSFLVKLDVTNLHCNICETPLDTLEDLYSHLKVVHKKPLHDVKNHFVPFKFLTDSFDCAMCTNSYNSFKALLEHMSTHYSNYICKVCGAGFVTSRILQTHGYRHKTGEFPCSTCKKVFKTRTNRNEHERSVHKLGSKKNPCPYCGKMFGHYTAKNLHMAKVHGVDLPALQCKCCDRAFPTQNRLNQHIKRDHLGERDFECEVCGKGFFAKRQLEQHEVYHTGVRDFQCDVCSKRFFRKSALIVHLRIHNNEKKFTCGTCDRAFSQNSSLKTHMKLIHNVFW